VRGVIDEHNQALILDLSSIPSDKRLVIEFVTLRLVSPATQEVVPYVATSVDDQEVPYDIEIQRAATARGFNVLVATERVTIVADPGTQVKIGAKRIDDEQAALGEVRIQASLSGYLEPKE
jgi:hypothetical protein